MLVHCQNDNAGLCIFLKGFSLILLSSLKIYNKKQAVVICFLNCGEQKKHHQFNLYFDKYQAS
jgi:hypothetical protein